MASTSSTSPVKTDGNLSVAPATLAASLAALSVAAFGLGLAVAPRIAKSSAQSAGAPKNAGKAAADLSGPFDPAKRMTLEEFQEHYAFLREDLVAHAKKDYELPDAGVTHVLRMLDYNVPGGKLNRGMATVHAAQALSGLNTPEALRCFAALGWAIEWMQASFLVADDMMDSSITRRGQPCWYRNPDINQIAINDALVLLTQLEIILARHVRGPYASVIRDLLMETTYATELGQLLDLSTQPPGGSFNLKNYTMDRYAKIVKYKTAFYSFVTPVRLGLYGAGVADEATHNAAKEVLLLMGEYFQIQDDVLDVYGDPKVIGKIGTDIQDAKCSWLAVRALERATPEQRAVMELNYGKHDEKCVAAIKKLFAEMKLQDLFNEYEEAVVGQLRGMISRLENHRLAQVCNDLLGKIYKRLK